MWWHILGFTTYIHTYTYIYRLCGLCMSAYVCVQCSMCFPFLVWVSLLCFVLYIVFPACSQHLLHPNASLASWFYLPPIFYSLLGCPHREWFLGLVFSLSCLDFLCMSVFLLLSPRGTFLLELFLLGDILQVILFSLTCVPMFGESQFGSCIFLYSGDVYKVHLVTSGLILQPWPPLSCVMI